VIEVFFATPFSHTIHTDSSTKNSSLIDQICGPILECKQFSNVRINDRRPSFLRCKNGPTVAYLTSGLRDFVKKIRSHKKDKNVRRLFVACTQGEETIWIRRMKFRKISCELDHHHFSISKIVNLFTGKSFWECR